MNEVQILKQLRYLLRARQWTGGSALVFASQSVAITISPTEQGLLRMVPPVVLLRPSAVAADPTHGEEPQLLSGTILARLIGAVAGDDIGEGVLIGANRVDGMSGGSRNRGIFELERELLATIAKLNGANGMKIQCRHKGGVDGDIDNVLGHVAWRDYQFEAWFTALPFYHPPTRFVATGGVGSVALSWQLPPDRFDRNTMVLRRAVGATPPATATDGTGVSLSGPLATSKTDVLAAGTYSYSLFMGYDDFEDDIITSYSDALSKASVVVT